MEKEPPKQSLTILQQIEELKNWHKQQQLKLNTDSVETKKESLQNIEKEKPQIQTTPNEKNVVSQQVFDEIPIQVASPNFRDLVENNLPPSSNQHTKPTSSAKQPHRFLKKGEGIARFGMGPRKVPKAKSKNNRVLCLSGSGPSTKKDTQQYIANPEKQNLKIEPNLVTTSNSTGNNVAVLPLEVPDLKLGLKNWKQILESGKAEEIIEKAIINNQLDLFEPDSSLNSSTASNLEKIFAVAKNWKEKQELKAFEAMEQHVLDSSFCSTSSFVVRVMQDAVISTPTKSSTNCKKDVSSNYLPTAFIENEVHIHSVKENEKQLRPELPMWTDPKSLRDYDFNSQNSEPHKNLEESLHVRFAENVDYKSFTDYSQSLSNSNQNNDACEVYNENKEWQEEDSVCSSHCDCSTTYSSSDEDVRAFSPPGKPPSMLQGGLTTENPKRTSPVERLEMTDLERKSTQDIDNQQPTASSGINLEKKMKELEQEIEVFKTVNKQLESVRESLEKERKLLQQEKKKFLKEIEEEKLKSTAQLEEERKKLNKEKLVFEKHSKSLSKNPTKEERKEIQLLREQLSEIKEELNKKESRWGAAQARVRNQVKLLEEDNKKLREEVELLRKQARYLEILTQKRKGKPFNNTKLIHAISEYISNNPLDRNPNEIPGVGSYFSSKENPVKTILVEVDAENAANFRVIREDEHKTKSGKSCDFIEKSYQQMVIGGKTTGEKQNSTKKESTLSTKEVFEKNDTKDTFNKPQQIRSNLGKPLNQCPENMSSSPKEVIHDDGTREKVYPDGRKEIKYKNGNIKKIDPFNGSEKTIYFNGDVKEILQDGTSKYYFSESRVWQTTLPDGLELLDFPNGQVEKKHLNGLVETIYANGCKKVTFPDGSEEVHYTDGTKLRIEADKTQTIFLLNGQKEIHTGEYVRREYPDGTMKTVYPDGVTETVYSNGRVRLKDKDGNLVMDSATSAKGV